MAFLVTKDYGLAASVPENGLLGNLLSHIMTTSVYWNGWSKIMAARYVFDCKPLYQTTTLFAALPPPPKKKS